MAFCTKCGAQFPDGSAFCTSCGAPVAAAPAPQQPAQAPVPQPQPQQQYQQQYQQAAPAPNQFDHTAEFDPKDISENKVIAMATYLLGFIGIIIALIASSESKYAAFHVRQSLKLQVTEALCLFMMIIPFLGWIAAGVCIAIIEVLNIIAFFQVCGGKAKEPAIIRSFGFMK